MPTQNANRATPRQGAAPQQEQHVVASPNPSVDDSKAATAASGNKVEAARVRPAQTKRAAPMKSTAKRKKPRRQRRGGS